MGQMMNREFARGYERAAKLVRAATAGGYFRNAEATEWQRGYRECCQNVRAILQEGAPPQDPALDGRDGRDGQR